MKRLHIKDAEAQGFTIDHVAAGRPWAYKGPRFAATEACECYTELETEMMAQVEYLNGRLDLAHERIEELKSEIDEIHQSIDAQASEEYDK